MQFDVLSGRHKITPIIHRGCLILSAILIHLSCVVFVNCLKLSWHDAPEFTMYSSEPHVEAMRISTMPAFTNFFVPRFSPYETQEEHCNTCRHGYCHPSWKGASSAKAPDVRRTCKNKEPRRITLRSHQGSSLSEVFPASK